VDYGEESRLLASHFPFPVVAHRVEFVKGLRQNGRRQKDILGQFREMHIRSRRYAARNCAAETEEDDDVLLIAGEFGCYAYCIAGRVEFIEELATLGLVDIGGGMRGKYTWKSTAG
jgi:hypothetical protein